MREPTSSLTLQLFLPMRRRGSRGVCFSFSMESLVRALHLANTQRALPSQTITNTKPSPAPSSNIMHARRHESWAMLLCTTQGFRAQQILSSFSWRKKRRNIRPAAVMYSSRTCPGGTTRALWNAEGYGRRRAQQFDSQASLIDDNPSRQFLAAVPYANSRVIQNFDGRPQWKRTARTCQDVE